MPPGVRPVCDTPSLTCPGRWPAVLLVNRDPLALARGFRFWAWLHVVVLIVAVVAVLVLLCLADAPGH